MITFQSIPTFPPRDDLQISAPDPMIELHVVWCMVGQDGRDVRDGWVSWEFSIPRRPRTGDILNKKSVYTESSTSSSSDERAPPLPKRRTQLTGLHHLYQLVHLNKSLDSLLI